MFQSKTPLMGIAFFVAILTLLGAPVSRTYAVSTISNVTWCYTVDSPPANDLSAADAVQITASLNNLNANERTYRVGVRLLTTYGTTVVDHTFAGPTHIFGNTTGTLTPTLTTIAGLNRLAAVGNNLDVREAYGEVQNSYPVPANGSATLTTHLTLAKERETESLRVELYAYDFVSNVLEATYANLTIPYDSTKPGCLATATNVGDNLGTGATIATLITQGAGGCGNNLCGRYAEAWVNTDKPIYTPDDTHMVFEFAALSGADTPEYTHNFSSYSFEIHDLDDASPNAVMTMVGSSSCTTTPLASGGVVSGLLCRLQTGYAARVTPTITGYTYTWAYPASRPAQTYVMTLPINLVQNPWLVSGHRYEIRMLANTGTSSHYIPTPNFDRFLYIVPQAVTLNYFTATCRPSDVLLEWETASEVNALGFNLFRSTSPGELGSQLNSEMIPTQAPGGGGAYYAYPDSTVSNPATYYYTLQDVGMNGQTFNHEPVSTMYPCVPTAVEVSQFGSRANSVGWLGYLVGGVIMAGIWVGVRRYRA